MNAVESGGYRQHDVPAESIQKWQKIVDLMAAIFDMPAGLIMGTAVKEASSVRLR